MNHGDDTAGPSRRQTDRTVPTVHAGSKTVTPAAFDARVQTFGREIFARLDRTGPTPLTKPWLDEKMMGLTMGHEALKVQLFRFVDTLPYLIGDPKELARHLREYLGEAGANLPWWVRVVV